MAHKCVSCFVALALAFAGAAASALADDTPAPTTPSDADLANQRCAIGEEKYLPADYYYCLGSQTYGQGHYGEAKKFFTTAASWASKPAQYVLGVMALHGDHQPADTPLALAWLALAAERRQDNFVGAYKEAYAAASPRQHREAETLLAKMRPVYGDATAAPRAEERYRNGIANLTRGATGSDVSCVSGVYPIGQGPNGSNSTVACMHIAELTQTIDRAAAQVFDGWNGHVSVGQLQPVRDAAPTR